MRLALSQAYVFTAFIDEKADTSRYTSFATPKPSEEYQSEDIEGWGNTVTTKVQPS